MKFELGSSASDKDASYYMDLIADIDSRVIKIQRKHIQAFAKDMDRKLVEEYLDRQTAINLSGALE